MIALATTVRADTPAGVPRRARAAAKVAAHELSNVARSRWLLAYALCFFLTTDALLRFGGGGGRALLSLVSVVLFVIPLVALVFGTTYLYDAREFTELLLAQPVGRDTLFAGLYAGLAVPLSVAFAAGVGLPFLWRGIPAEGAAGSLLVLIGAGVLLTLTFVALAFAIAVGAEDKVRGLGIAIGTWLALSLVYDALVLVGVATLSDYPIERPLLALMLANPVDLARVLLLMRLDAGAVQGYTGAVFTQFFGSAGGGLVAVAVMLAWVALPLALALRAFRRRDF